MPGGPEDQAGVFEALQEAELRTRAILETAADGIIVISQSGLIQSFNPAAERIFGYPAAEVLGLNVNVLMPEPYHSGHDSYLEHYLTTGERRIIGIGRTVEGRRKDGATFPLELAVSVTELAGGPVFTGIVRDVTERVLAENALRDAAERMRAVLDTAVDGIIVIDHLGFIEAFNPAAERIFGYSAGEVRGQNISGLMPQEFATHHDDYLANYARTGIARIIGIGREVVGRRKDGSQFPMDLSVGETILEERRLYTGIVRDITERKRSEEALREAQKLESLGVMAGGIAHDFNNLLVGILGNAGLAADELPPESPAMPLIRDIESAGRRAAELAHQMLAYSGRGRFVIEALHLNALVEEMTRLLQVSIGKDAHVRYNFAPDVPLVEADATQVRQVVMNLVINASDAIGNRPGTITISTGSMHADREFLTESYLAPDLEPGDYAFIEVSDTGGGMSPETRARIFDPFFTTKFTGRGLGLAVVLGVVRGHRGAIKVYSELGHGTTFKILLPAAAGSGVTPSPARWTTSGVALIIDDDEVVRRVVARMVQGTGLRVLTAEDGSEGVEVLRQHRDEVTVVLLDLTMPRMGGEQALAHIRTIRPDLPVIVMSGYNETETRERFAGKRVAGFIQKPFENAQLRQLIRDTLERPTGA